MDGVVLIVAGIGIASILWALVARSRAAHPRMSDGERALEDATAKLSARLDALSEPRPERALAALDVEGYPSIEGDLEVPPRAIVFGRFSKELGRRMLALREESHPTDGSRILQLEAPYQAEAVIYDASGALVWAPEGACDLVFRRGGTEVIEVGSIYEERPAEHQVGSLRLESPLQSEFTWFLARHRWPSRELIRRGTVSFPQGLPVRLSLSPDERRACIVYVDQCEGGLLVLELEGERVAPRKPLFQQYTNLLGLPAWSPRSDCVAIAATAGPGWWGPARGATSRGAVGGRVLAAFVFVEDLETNESSRHDIELELPAGWGADMDENARLRPPSLRFVDDATIEVTLAHGPPITLPRRGAVP